MRFSYEDIKRPDEIKKMILNLCYSNNYYYIYYMRILLNLNNMKHNTS